MKHCLLTLAFFLFVTCSPSFGQDLLLVANKADNTLFFINAQTLKVIDSTTTGKAPHEVAVTPDGKQAFTANFMDNTLSVIDVAAREEVRRIDLAPYAKPHGLAISDNGESLYVTVEGSKAVIEVDTETGEVLRSIETGQEGTHMVVLSADEETLYAANLGSGTTTVIDLTGEKAVKTIDTGEGTEGIAITPNGEEVWVSARSGSVAVIDTETNEIVAAFPAEGTPIRVEITPDGRSALVSCVQSGEVIVFDVADRMLLQDVEAGAGPVGIQITPDGERAFIANTQDDAVVVIDLEKFVVTDTISVGQEPDGMGFVPGQ